MKKKILSLLMSLGMVFGVGTFSACDMEDALDMVVEVEELNQQLSSLEKENQALKAELATLKFEVTFPNGLVTESCILNDVVVDRDTVNPEGSVYAVRADGEAVEVTINGGSYNAGSGSLYNIAVWAHNGSKIVINDGVFKTGADVNGDANHVVYAAGNSIIEINGGWFESVGVDAPMMINCQDGKGTIVIKGGTFVNFDPSNCVSEGEGTNFVAEGYTVIKETANGIDYYTVVEIPNVEDIEDETPTEEIPSEF